tara:strand:+ start:347 stop:2143 length:1797 start_codon:yes stop_codon:yes gene_type:complete
MGITKLENQNLNNDAIGSGEIDTGAVDTSKISAEIKNEDISPSANISASKLALPGPPSQFVRGDGSFGAIDTTSIDENAFNIGVLGFKMAVNEGLTIFNLVDGIVDEFNNESGVDTAENTNASYDSTSDFYTNDTTTPSPATTNIQAFWHSGGDFETGTNESTPYTYTAPPTAKSIDLLVVGGGGGGGRWYGPNGGNQQHAGGGGAGGLVYIENFPVVGGGTYPITVGAGGKDTAEPNVRNGGDTTFTSPTPTPFGTSIIGEGGGGAGGFPNGVANQGGSAGGEGWEGDSTQDFKTATQATNHPIPGITPLGANAVDHPQYGVNTQGSYGNDGAAFVQPSGPYPGTLSLYRGGSGGGAGEAATVSGGPTSFSDAGDGMEYNIADGSTSISYAGGGTGGRGTPSGNSSEEPGGGGLGGGTETDGTNADSVPTNPLLSGTSPPQFGPQIAALSFGGGGGGGGAENPPNIAPGYGPYGGDGGSGVVYASVSQTGSITSNMTLVSDTFTASSTPSKARIVVFAELPDGTSDFTVSATRDNSTFNAITLTDEGYEAGSSGIKIFTGSTPLTGSASPQVQLRWKIVGSSLTGANKIHGVSLQWE